MPHQHDAHQHSGWDEHGCRDWSDVVEGRRGERRGDEEPDTAARREQAHRGGVPAGGVAGVAPGRRVEHRDAESGEQQHGEHQRVRRHQPREPGSRPGQRDPQRGEPRQPPPVGQHAEDQLRHRAAQGRGEREAGRLHVAEVLVQHEEGHRGGDQALIEVVDCVGSRPQPHVPPRGVRAARRGAGRRIHRITVAVGTPGDFR